MHTEYTCIQGLTAVSNGRWNSFIHFVKITRRWIGRPKREIELGNRRDGWHRGEALELRWCLLADAIRISYPRETIRAWVGPLFFCLFFFFLFSYLLQKEGNTWDIISLKIWDNNISLIKNMITHVIDMSLNFFLIFKIKLFNYVNYNYS